MKNISIELVHEKGKVNIGKVLTRVNPEGTRMVEVYAKDEEGINNVAVVTNKAGLIGVSHEIPFKLKSNLKAKKSYNDRVDQWLIRNNIL